MAIDRDWADERGYDRLMLTQKEKETFFEDFVGSHYQGIVTLQNYIKQKTYTDSSAENLYDLVKFVKELNAMVDFGETFDGVCAKNYDKIREVYDIMLQDLLDLCEITDEDFEKYWYKGDANEKR